MRRRPKSSRTAQRFRYNGGMTSREVRSSFLEYFEKHGHTDRAELVARAGRRSDAPLHERRDEPVQGRLPRQGEARPTSARRPSQKVMRVSGKHNDLDNVGPSHRHHTFFEMLGNFSFGDYFKKDAIPFAWDAADRGLEARSGPAVSDHLQGGERHPARRRGVRDLDAVRARRIGSRRSAPSENFWQMGETGPCGRCSEIMFYRPEAPCTRGRSAAAWSAAAIATSRSGTTCSWSSTARRRRAAAAAGAVGRHRHGLRAHHVGAAEQVLELRHRHLHADPRRDRRGGRPAVHALPRRRRSPGRLDARRSRITCAR